MAKCHRQSNDARHGELAGPARRSSSPAMISGGPAGGLASLPVPISTPGFDAAPYLTATLCITVDPESRIRNIGTIVRP